jgi:translation initiation factor 2B subunit (eIF-2B alpha/beta/delta family)
MSRLLEAVRMLKDDHDNGASVLATKALEALMDLTAEIHNPFIAQDLWESICQCGWELKNARPSMDAAIGGALIMALSHVRTKWDAEFGPNWPTGGCRGTTMKNAAIAAIKEIRDTRKKALECLTTEFTTWMRGKCEDLTGRSIRILTLSYSSSMKACLLAALQNLPKLNIELRIMESRPRFEGVSLSLALFKDIDQKDRHRLSIQVESDASVAMLARDLDIVLLGADRISRSGCVSNKIGSLAAVLCAKALSPTAKVVVVSESDKIVLDTNLQNHAEEANDNSEIRVAWGKNWERSEKELQLENGRGELLTRNVYFETVEGRYIDEYICERGILSVEDVERVSINRGEKEAQIFGQF